MNFRIQTKLLVYILSTSLFIYILAFGYLSYNDHELSINESKHLTDAYSEKYANFIMMKLNVDMGIARTLVQSYSNYDWIFDNGMQDLYIQMLKDVLINNPQFHNAALNFELGAIKRNYDKPFGRIRYVLYKTDGVINERIDTLEIDGDDVGSPYYDMKINPREDMSEPYLFSSSGKEEDLAMISSISIPITKNNNFVGLVQFDVNLERFNDMIGGLKPFPGSFGFLVSNSGKFVAIHEKKYLNKSIETLSKRDNIDFKIAENIQKGKSFSYMRYDSLDVQKYVSFYPVQIGKSDAPWALGTSTPFNIMIKKADENLFFSVIIAILGFVLLTFVLWSISSGISKPLKKTSSIIKELAKGKISLEQKMEITARDEIADISSSVNSLIDGLDNNLKFALEIGIGNLDFKFKPLSTEDFLGKALLDMRKSLKQARIEEAKRKAEDKKLNWATKGAAEFAEFMTQYTDNLEEFSYVIISNLVKYVNASQGGLFIINDAKDTDVTVDLLASYAYNRRKYLEKKIPMGVGMVGRCINEAETIYLTDVPDDYLNITSGLGEAAPRSVLLVPIVFNQQVLGVIEVASVYNMEDYQIKFVERTGESIASTISNVKINQQTARLLEESKIQSEELVAQEEEMRQNMEEMKTTQEELEKKAFESKSMLNAINTVALVAEYNMQGRIIDINQGFLRLVEKTKEEMIGKLQGAFTSLHEETVQFSDFWDGLRKGEVKKIVQRIVINGKDIWLTEAYIPIFDQNGVPYKVLNISTEIRKPDTGNIKTNV
ncbi:MAG: hypothetical protein B6I20_11135 [Bacteroidetes bacterium 4572_117]|nr:MAG: hypothetical protein B6I20_11135 [Bacteroidetes bacterium 4572_117]